MIIFSATVDSADDSDLKKGIEQVRTGGTGEIGPHTARHHSPTRLKPKTTLPTSDGDFIYILLQLAKTYQHSQSEFPDEIARPCWLASQNANNSPGQRRSGEEE